jgi:hypothetical protein
MATIKYLVDLDLTKNQLLNVVVQNLAIAPNNPKDGQIYWDTADKTLYVWKTYSPIPSSAPFGEWVDLGSSGITNLDYVAAETNGLVTSSTGNNATIPLATLVAGTNKAGFLSPAEKTKLAGIEANAKDDQSAIEVPVSPAINAKTNVQAALEDHETRITTVTSASHDAVTLDSVVDVTAQAASLSGQQLTLKKATTSTDGVMSSEDKTKLDTVATNAQQNIATNLAVGTRTATAFPVTNNNGTGVTIPEASITEAGLLNAADKVKVNNAVLTTQSAIIASFLSLSASLAENSDTKIASQKATKSYVDALVLSYGALVFQDGYDASTDTPKLDSTPFATGIKRGWTYAVSAAGDFFTEAVEAGDLLVARQDSPTTRAHWVIINKNIPDVLSTLLVGFVVGANSTITSSDSILVAFGKVQAQLNNKEGGITAGTTSQYFRGDKTFQTLNTTVVPEGNNLYYTDVRVRATPLTGLSIANATPIVAADTILIASGKLQGQIDTKNALISHLEFNNTDLTVWNNGKGNIASNTSFGDGALQSNSTGINNQASGANALQFNSTGSNNQASGANALQFNSTSSNNQASGANALRFNSTGSNNQASGTNALRSNSTGSNNTASGLNSGLFIADGTTSNTNSNNSLFLGSDTKALADNQTNQIVIGSTAIGLGSNSAILGNSSITTTGLRGRVLVNTIADNGVDNLQITGSQTSTGQIKSTVATNTAPLVVASTTKVTNLNADLLDGLHSSDFYLATNPSSFTGKVVSVSSSTSLVSTFAIAHTFGADVIANARFVSDNSVFLCEVIMTNNLVTFNVNTPIAANSVKFIIIG